MARAVALAACIALFVASALAEECPLRSAFNGCLKNGCLTLESGPRGRTATMVCNECGKGYVLVEKGTRNAKCECAPGFAGRGNQGICRACPAGTQIALGGSVLRSTCLNCPAETIVSNDGTTCLCPAGTHHASGPPRGDLAGVSCRACTGNNQYMDLEGHAEPSCKTCPSSQVANKEHTACVAVEPNAAPTPAGFQLPPLSFRGSREPAVRAASTDGSSNKTADSAGSSSNSGKSPFSGLQQAIQNLRLKAEEAAAARMDEEPQKGNSLTNLVSRGIEAVQSRTLAPPSAPSDSKDNKSFNLGGMLKKIGKLRESLDPMNLIGANRVDPSVLADAGLPAVSTASDIVSNALRETIGGLDTSDWSTGI